MCSSTQVMPTPEQHKHNLLFSNDKIKDRRENNAALAKHIHLENFTDKTPLNKNLSLIVGFNAERYAIQEN